MAENDSSSSFTGIKNNSVQTSSVCSSSPQSEALFNICVIVTKAQSYLHHAPKSVLFQAERKKWKYSDAATACNAHFTLLCFTVDGLGDSKATYYIKRLG